MKITLASLATLAGLVPSVRAGAPGQNFFVPLPEATLFSDTFTKIHYGTPSAPVHTLLAVTVSVDGTLVAYDHWEDGYDEDSMNPPAGGTTEIWGDGDHTNGCRPRAKSEQRSCNSPADDAPFVAGDTVIIEEEIPIPRDPSHIMYDGGDHIRGTFPLTVVRGAFPDSPGSLLAGAVEVLEKRYWGLSYEMPVKRNDDLGANDAAFEYCSVFVMAAEDGTTLTLPGGTTVSMNKGDSNTYSVAQKGDVFAADKPIQVQLLTGDVNSNYELRWFTILPRETWHDKYLTPVGTSKGEAKVVIYNPVGNGRTTFKYKYYRYTGSSYPTTRSITINEGDNAETRVIPNESGCYVYQENGKKFLALSMVDTEGGGQIYDWGSPIPALNMLTSQVLVGLGFGCTHNECDRRGVRSVVWIAPTEDAKIYVDFDNDGTISGADVNGVRVDQYRSYKVHDADEDMSGAVIYATKQNSDEPVPISVVWGQDPDLAVVNDYDALDLGTLIAPFGPVQVSETVKVLHDNDNDGHCSPGDVVQWTISIQNVGQTNIAATDLKIVANPIDDQTIYRTTSTTWRLENPNTAVKTGSITDVGSTDWPIDENGYVVPEMVAKRGGQFNIIFEATVKDGAFIRDPPLKLFDSGVLYQYNNPAFSGPLPYDANIPVVLPPPATCNSQVTVSGADTLPWGGAAEQYQCGASVSYNRVPAVQTLTLMGYNPNGDDEVLGEITVSDQMPSEDRTNNPVTLSEQLPLSCNNQGQIEGANGPTGINTVPLMVYVKGPCGASPQIPVQCSTNPAGEENGGGSCSALLSLSGPESIHEDSNRPFHCTGPISYQTKPSEEMLTIKAVSPAGEEEEIGTISLASFLTDGPVSGKQMNEQFSLFCDGNNLRGPSGPSRLGANGQEVQIYVIGPCGQTNKIPTVCRNDGGGGANGDPHVKTWRKTHFDFNGACDMILLQAADFQNGLGLDVHIRTHLRKDMSYISNAALRIGNDILEVASKGVYSVNGLLSATMPASLSGFEVKYEYVEKTKQHVFEIHLGGHQKIWLKVYRDFVSVLVDAATPADFGGSVGLMGDFNTGHLLARDGHTIIDDIDAFGYEWQITDTEPKLFQDKDRFPQFPDKCVMPSQATAQSRRLSEDDKDFLLAAEKACAQYEGDAQQDCIYDVITTRDLNMADAGSY